MGRCAWAYRPSASQTTRGSGPLASDGLYSLARSLAYSLSESGSKRHLCFVLRLHTARNTIPSTSFSLHRPLSSSSTSINPRSGRRQAPVSQRGRTMASAEQPRSSVPPPPSLVRLNSHSHSHSNPNSHPNSNTPLSHSSLPPLLPSPISGYASLADGIKNSPRRMNTDTALPLVGSSSSSIGSGAGEDRDVNGGQQRRTGASATPGPAADNGAADANANGSGSGSGDAAGAKPKKKKKKGWKGWALVLEDEEGNVIEVRDRGESPETEKRRVEEDAEKERATRAAASRGEL